MSAKQINCSLHLILRTPCGSSRDKESRFFSVGVQHICRAIIYRNVVMLLKPSLSWLARAGTRVMSVTPLTRFTICPKHRPLLGRFYRAPKSCQVTSLAENTRHKLPNGRRNVFFLVKLLLLLSDHVGVKSFAGFGYFFLNRELFPIVRLHIYILLYFTFEFLGGQSPSPVQKFAQTPHLRII